MSKVRNFGPFAFLARVNEGRVVKGVFESGGLPSLRMRLSKDEGPIVLFEHGRLDVHNVSIEHGANGFDSTKHHRGVGETNF